jgi:hypothetical protein
MASNDRFTKVVLSAGTCMLAVIALRPIFMSTPVEAQSPSNNLYIEPGVISIRNPDGGGTIGDGRMMIDMKTGDVWGFPTQAGSPYPIDPINKTPPTSKPVYLGRFDLSAMRTP